MSYDLGMRGIIAVVLSVLFAAFCLWLTVRIISRREEWAKWTAIGIVLTVFVGYPLSLFPILWYETRGLLPKFGVGGTVFQVYTLPVEKALENGPEWIETGIQWMADVVGPAE